MASIGGVPPPVRRVAPHDVTFDGRAKMPLQASIFASWYNIPKNLPNGKYRRHAAARATRSAARCDIDGLAEMPLQASISASWFNMLGILPWAKSGGFAALCAFARLRNSTAEQKCRCGQLLLPAGGAFAFSARSFANRSMCVIGGGARVLQESVIQNL